VGLTHILIYIIKVALVIPDTSPRGAGVEGEEDSWDFGTGAGFYVDATAAPWATNYKMYSYISAELPALVEAEFKISPTLRSISGVDRQTDRDRQTERERERERESSIGEYSLSLSLSLTHTNTHIHTHTHRSLNGRPRRADNCDERHTFSKAIPIADFNSTGFKALTFEFFFAIAMKGTHSSKLSLQ
jgi:hypothetical protein